MALEYTEEKLNSLDKETIIQLFLSQQEQQIGRASCRERGLVTV